MPTIVDPKDPLFPLGRVVMTVGVARVAEKSEAFNVFVLSTLPRHAQRDWGELGNEDHQANDQALIDGERIFSSYQLGPRLLVDAPIDNEQNQLWLIAEADRSITTILWPHNY